MDENTGKAQMSERLNRVGGPRTTTFREREIPLARIVMIDEHYVVHAGCMTGVFHTPQEVEKFLHRLLTEWVNNNLGGGEAEKNPVEPRMVATRGRL